MVKDWVLAKLETISDSPCALINDPLQLLPEADGAIHNFAREHGFTVIVAATNLVFRELYVRALNDPEVKKLLVIDRAPARRRAMTTTAKAPPPFYPDFLARTPAAARIELDLRQYLKELTGDPSWPAETNDSQYARLISNHLDAVVRAHSNLRSTDASRFTDNDFKRIVAYAALGVADAAFKKLDAKDYWRIGLLGHDALDELTALAPEVTQPILEELQKAPAPFCCFAEHDTETVLRAFYLSVILAQHVDNGDLVLAKLDPSLAALPSIKKKTLTEAAPKLVDLDKEQAAHDLQAVEDSLNKDNLQFLLIDQLKANTPEGFAAILQNEGYSNLLRSGALLMALDDLLSAKPTKTAHDKIAAVILPDGDSKAARFADACASVPWSQLRDAYGLARMIQPLREELAHGVRTIGVLKPQQHTFKLFRDLWNLKKVNRLEYYLSALERRINSGELLPRAEQELPSAFSNALDRARQRVKAIIDEVLRQLDDLNRRFQAMVVAQYPSWVAKDGEVCLTSQFLRRCLKPNWDPQTEKAVVFTFDGMRYDIWDELLRPMFEDRMDIVADLAGSSLLPSETHVTRKAISAGTYPDQFDTRSGEDKLLKEGLAREVGYPVAIEVMTPEGAGTGETVRYRAGNLEMYIFEVCDKELHKIQSKTLPDGREVPSRPLAFIYQQHIKNLIDTEIMAIVRKLDPGTKVFVVADHGFGRIHRERLWLEAAWLNEPEDCAYLNAWLRQSLTEAGAPAKVRENVWELPIAQLRMPATETVTDRKTKQTWQKKFSSIVFPKTGYALSRPGANFHPDAYSHGGISVQELMIPMIVLRVKQREEGPLIIDQITGPVETVEGEEATFILRLTRPSQGAAKLEELRVDMEATYSRETDQRTLPHQVVYVTAKGGAVTYRFVPDPNDATDEERKQGAMERTLTVTLSYRDGRRTARKSRVHRFTVRLNSEQVIRRVPSHLGNILGLTPKSMR